MLRKEDLEILSYLLEELKKPSKSSGLMANNLPNWYKEKFNSTDTKEKNNKLNNEFKRLINVFSKYNIGSYHNNKGYIMLKHTPLAFSADFNKLYEKQIEEEKKSEIDFEVKKTGLKLNKWLLKTRWLPHIVAVISVIISIYSFFYNQSKFENEIDELKYRMEVLEKKNVLEENI